jgi:hypothetical protein
MTSLKERKGYMKNLQDELNKSRMAVVSIYLFRKLSPLSKIIK